MTDKMNLTMLVDFYELSMANGYFEKGLGNQIAYFDMFFRKIPDDGVPEQLTEVIDPVRDAQPVTHGTGIVYVAVGAAGLGLCLPGDVLLRTVQSHGCAKDIESCTLQQACRDRAVYSAAYCRADGSDSVHS